MYGKGFAFPLPLGLNPRVGNKTERVPSKGKADFLNSQGQVATLPVPTLTQSNSLGVMEGAHIYLLSCLSSKQKSLRPGRPSPAISMPSLG